MAALLCTSRTNGPDSKAGLHAYSLDPHPGKHRKSIAPPALKPDALRPESAATPTPAVTNGQPKTEEADNGSAGWDNPRYAKLLKPQTEEQKREEAKYANDPTPDWLVRGPNPGLTPWGPSFAVHDAIKDQLNDPDSYKMIRAYSSTPSPGASGRGDV